MGSLERGEFPWSLEGVGHNKQQVHHVASRGPLFQHKDRVAWCVRVSLEPLAKLLVQVVCGAGIMRSKVDASSSQKEGE